MKNCEAEEINIMNLLWGLGIFAVGRAEIRKTHGIKILIHARRIIFSLIFRLNVVSLYTSRERGEIIALKPQSPLIPIKRKSITRARPLLPIITFLQYFAKEE